MKEKAISDKFFGTTKSIVSCPICKHQSPEEYYAWSVLSLSLDKRKQENILQDLLVKNTDTEDLEENTQKCRNCKGVSNRRLTKKLTLTSTPEILVLHLKRFEWSKGGEASKIKKHVIYQEQIDMASSPNPWEREERLQKYCLKGVVVHIGDHITNGHYAAFAKGTMDSWFQLNDELVNEVALETVLNQEAYMLFYERTKHPKIYQNCLNNRILLTQDHRHKSSLSPLFEKTLQEVNWRMLAERVSTDRECQLLGGSQDDENEAKDIEAEQKRSETTEQMPEEHNGNKASVESLPTEISKSQKKEGIFLCRH